MEAKMTQHETQNTRKATLITALFIAAVTSSASAQIRYVDDDGLDCPHSPLYTTIQAAIDDSSEGDEVHVYPGTYTGTGNEVVSITFNDFYLRGVSVQGHRPKIDGENARRCITITGPDWLDLTHPGIRVLGFDLENGQTEDDGGGIYAEGNVMMTDLSIYQCNAEGSGGGLMAALPSFTQPFYTHVTLAESRVDYCTADLNGGGVSSEDAHLRVFGGEVTRCFAEKRGGGISFSAPIHAGQLFLYGLTDSEPLELSMNSANAGGGGLWLNGGGDHDISGLLFFENIARGNGGGALIEDAKVSLGRNNDGLQVTRNVTMERIDLTGGMGAGLCLFDSEINTVGDSWYLFDSNASEGDGAAIYMKHSSLELSQALFEGNVAVNERGGAITAISCPSLLLDEVYLWENTGLKGGALYLMNTFAQLTSLDVRGNTGTNGGALLVRGASSDVSVSDSLFMNNSPRHVRVISGSCTNAGGNSFN